MAYLQAIYRSIYPFCIWFVELELAELERDTVTTRRAAFSEGSNKNVRVQFRSFLLFCAYFHLTPVPVTTGVLLLYAQFLSRTFVSVASIKNYISGVRIVHLGMGVMFPEPDFSLNLLLKGLARLHPHEESRAIPITPLLLLRFFEVMDMSKSKDRAVWACFLVCFFMFARKSNMVPPSSDSFDLKKHLARADIHSQESGLVVLLKWSKTIQKGERHVLVPLLPLPGSPLCPRLAYDRMVGPLPVPGASPAFVYWDGRGKVVSLTQPEFVSRLRRLLLRVGVDPKGFSGHSFRRGGASCAFQAGVPGELVQLHGDWRSDAYLKYLAVPMQQRLQVTHLMRAFILASGGSPAVP